MSSITEGKKRKICEEEVRFEYTEGWPFQAPEDVTHVEFHPNVVTVEPAAFENCIELKKVVFNEGLKKIGKKAFNGCFPLDSVILPSSVVDIGRAAFQGCSNMREVVLNEGLEKLGAFAFWGTPIESILLPSTLTKIGNWSFQSSDNLREVVLNYGLKKIGLGAFEHCKSLESIIIPSTVKDIGRFTFRSCGSLKEVAMNAIVSRIGEGAFDFCNRLERFTFPCLSSRLESISRDGNGTELESKIDQICHHRVIQRSGNELFVSVAVMRGGSNWDTVKQSLDKIAHLITYYETREASTMFELALWQANMDQADDIINPNNREAFRIEVPGPVKETILAYLHPPTDCPSSDSEDSSEDDNDNDDESDSSINNDYYDGQQWE